MNQIKKLQEGGYPSNTLRYREYLSKLWDPSGRYDPLSWLASKKYGNHEGGEENEYYRAYLGLENNVPKMNKKAKTSWDDKIEKLKVDNGELSSDFYGTTPRMDLALLAIADTTNLGKIVRNYEYYKKKNPNLISKESIEGAYRLGKKVLDNPNKWQQMDADEAIVIRNPKGETEYNPLGMLAKFGMMWNPKNKLIKVHDTYDFTKLARMATKIPVRPKEMKIRGIIGFDPNKGSVLLRDDLKNYKLPKRIYE